MLRAQGLVFGQQRLSGRPKIGKTRFVYRIGIRAHSGRRRTGGCLQVVAMHAGMACRCCWTWVGTCAPCMRQGARERKVFSTWLKGSTSCYRQHQARGPVGPPKIGKTRNISPRHPCPTRPPLRKRYAEPRSARHTHSHKCRAFENSGSHDAHNQRRRETSGVDVTSSHPCKLPRVVPVPQPGPARFGPTATPTPCTCTDL